MKEQKDCAECLHIRPGKPRCGYCLSDLIGELHEKNIALKAQLAVAKAALEFYADILSWVSREEQLLGAWGNYLGEREYSLATDDDGKKARAALAKLEVGK